MLHEAVQGWGKRVLHGSAVGSSADAHDGISKKLKHEHVWDDSSLYY